MLPGELLLLMHVLGINWHDRIRNAEITDHTGLPAAMDLSPEDYAAAAAALVVFSSQT